MLSVRELSEAEFSTMAEEWQSCLEDSNANQLFMSWPWLYSWWETWSQLLGMELALFGVFDHQDKLVGIGPFCSRHLVTPIGLRVCRLYMIGNAWRLAPTVRTEYCGIVARRGYESAVNAILNEELESLEWDELICPDVSGDQDHGAGLLGFKYMKAYDVINRTDDQGVRLDCQLPFEDWLGGLGKNTRLKVFNRRTYLEKNGHLEFRRHDSNKDDDFFDLLNAFHIARWGKPAFDREALRFHRLLLKRLPLCQGASAASVLLFNDRCVSVLYDLVVGCCRYNLQSGYLENFDAKVSLGYLHLGFAIEQAHAHPKVECYDLLAGTGKKQFYKGHFHGANVKFSTFQVVRRRLLKTLYRIQKASPPRIARAFSRRAGL